MSISKVISESKESLQAYVNLSVSLQKMTFLHGSCQPKIKKLAFKKVNELKNKEEIIPILKEYMGSLIEDDKLNNFNFDHYIKRQKDFFFLVYFLKLIILTHGEDFVLIELIGQSPLHQKLNLEKNVQHVLGEIFDYQKIAKIIQKIVSTNDKLFGNSLKQVLGDIENQKNIITKDILIENKFLTSIMIDEVTKHLNSNSLVGIKPDVSEVIAKSLTDKNSDSDYYSDSSGSGSLVSPLPIEESRQRKKRHVPKKEYSEQKYHQSFSYVSDETLDLGYESGDELLNCPLELEKGQDLGDECGGKDSNRHLESALEEKLKKCLKKKQVYENRYKRYESYKDNNQLSEEELKECTFKFNLNKELYYFYKNYIEKEQDTLSQGTSSSYLAKVLRYYKFKHFINEYKLNKYQAHIKDIENNDQLEEKLEYYQWKCIYRYSRRLEYYESKYLLNKHNLHRKIDDITFQQLQLSDPYPLKDNQVVINSAASQEASVELFPQDKSDDGKNNAGLDFDADIGIDTDKAEELGKGQDACNTQVDSIAIAFNTQSSEEVPNNHQDEDKGLSVSSNDQTLLPEPNSLERQEREDIIETNNERINKDRSLKKEIIRRMLENNHEFRRSYEEGYEAGYDEGEQVAEFENEESNPFTLLDTTGIDLATADPAQSGYQYGYNEGYHQGYRDYNQYNKFNEIKDNIGINLFLIRNAAYILKMYEENAAFKKGYHEAYWNGHDQSYIKDAPVGRCKFIEIIDINLFVDYPFEAGYACGYNNGYKDGRIKYINEHNQYMVEYDDVSHHDIDTDDQDIDDVRTGQKRYLEHTVAGNSRTLFHFKAIKTKEKLCGKQSSLETVNNNSKESEQGKEDMDLI